MSIRSNARPPIISSVLICLFFLAVGILGVNLQLDQARQKSVEQSDIITKLKGDQIARWLEERLGDAKLFSTAYVLTHYPKPGRPGYQEARLGLTHSLEEILHAYHYQSVRIVDGNGHIESAVGEPISPDSEPLNGPLLTAIEAARKSSEPQSTNLYRSDTAPDRIFLDFVMAIPAEAGDKPLFLVLRADTQDFLFPFLLAWPTHSRTGELMLIRQTPDGPVVLNPLRHDANAPFRIRPYPQMEGRDESIPTSIVRDYRGQWVVRTSHMLPGVPWQIDVKEDLSEAYAKSFWNIGSIVVADLLLIMILLISNYLRYQRARLMQSTFENTQKNEQLHMQQELRDSNRRFVDIARASPDWIWETDPTGSQFTYLSDNITKALGYTPEELIGTPPSALFPPNERDQMLATLQQLRATRTPFIDLEHAMLHKDGSRRYVLTNGVPIIDDQGIFCGYRGTDRDITSRREKEEKIRKLSLAVEQGMNGVLITNREHVIEYVNDAYCASLGYSRDEVIGRRPGFAASGRTPPETYASLHRTLADEKIWRGAFHNRHRDGRIRIESTLISPIRQADGSVTHYVAIYEDITELQQQREELDRYREHLQELVEERTRQLDVARLHAENAEKLLREAVDSISQGFVLFDPEDRLVLCNDYYRACYPEMADTLVPGNTFANILKTAVERDIFQVQKSSLDHWIAERLEAHHSGNAQGHEYQLRSGRWLLTMEFRTPSGYYVGNRVDISALKNTERLLAEARDVADSANQAKSLFLANMSHEIRSPMNAIIGLSYLCLKTDLPAKGREYVTKVQKSATLLLRIINDILDFSKIESGKLEIERIPFILEEVIEHSAGLFATTLAERGIEFKIQIAPEVPGNLIGDPLRLGQVLSNLLGNATKFTEKGQIEVKIGRQYGRGNTEQNVTLMFSVSDSGVGMTPEQQSRLFQVFTQADDSITRKYGGTGLGLTISQELVELMGGRISVESNVGKGTRFSFSLPFAAAPAAQIAVPQAIQRQVLVVDDDNLTRLQLKRMLEKLGFAVTQVASGTQALLTINDRDQAFALIFMDWRMPELDGFETTERIRQIDTYRNTPVIMVTAGELSEIEAMNAKGIDRYLFKPIHQAMLEDVIADVTSDLDASPASAAKPARPLAGKRLLIVEDNEFNQAVACDILSLEGAEIDIASDGRQALQALEEKHYDLVLMDMQMPVMDGITATREIRRQPRYNALPIIAMTANALPEERERCMAAGMDDFITKPIVPEILAATLAPWVSDDPKMKRVAKPLPLSDTASKPPPSPALAAAVLPQTQHSFDIETGLGYVRGNRALYLKLLDNFMRNQAMLLPQLQDGIRNRDSQVVMRSAHTLRGIAATLGATELAKASSDLEKPLKVNADLDAVGELVTALERCLAKTVADVEPLKQSLAT